MDTSPFGFDAFETAIGMVVLEDEEEDKARVSEDKEEASVLLFLSNKGVDGDDMLTDGDGLVFVVE